MNIIGGEFKPLVSIIVITYNSSKYVLETLESAKAQTYENIELVISDDCSTDNTIDICSNWINENKDRFLRTELITVEQNTGIAPNCNRGLNVAKGEWVKLIAGDDVLLEDCIFEFILFSTEKSNARIIFSDVLNRTISRWHSFDDKNPKEQYKELLKGNFLPAPAAFLKRDVIEELGAFDEKYPMLEDFPFYLKALRNNTPIFHLNKPLVVYRMVSEGVSNNNQMSLRYYQSVYSFFKYSYLRQLKVNRCYLYYLNYLFEAFLLKFVLHGILTRRSTFYFFIKWFGVISWQRRVERLFLS